MYLVLIREFMADFVKVATTDKLKEGSLISANVNGVELVIGNNKGNYFAMNNTCSHEDCPLNEGYMEDSFLVCGCHLAKFDLKTGKVDASTPWGKQQKVFEVKVKGKDILVKV